MKRFALPAVLLSVAMGLVACGDDSSSSAAVEESSSSEPVQSSSSWTLSFSESRVTDSLSSSSVDTSRVNSSSSLTGTSSSQAGEPGDTTRITYALKRFDGPLTNHIAGMKRVNVMCTHDYLVVPLLAYTTDGHANVRYFEKYRWVNYMAGVAMIISADGSVRYIPVKGLETGIM